MPLTARLRRVFCLVLLATLLASSCSSSAEDASAIAGEPVVVPTVGVAGPSGGCQLTADEYGNGPKSGDLVETDVCGTVELPDRAGCFGRWGSSVDRPDVLVVTEDAQLFQFLEAPTISLLTSTICIERRGTSLFPCGDARKPGEPWLFDLGYSIPRYHTRWAAYEAGLPIITRASSPRGSCDRSAAETVPNVWFSASSTRQELRELGAPVQIFVSTEETLDSLLDDVEGAGLAVSDGLTIPTTTCMTLWRAIRDNKTARTHAGWTFEYATFGGSLLKNVGGVDYDYEFNTPFDVDRQLADLSADLEEIRSTVPADEVWLRDALEQWIEAVATDWPAALELRRNAGTVDEIYAFVDAAPEDHPALVTYNEIVGLINQSVELANCRGDL